MGSIQTRCWAFVCFYPQKCVLKQVLLGCAALLVFLEAYLCSLGWNKFKRFGLLKKTYHSLMIFWVIARSASVLRGSRFCWKNIVKISSPWLTPKSKSVDLSVKINLGKDNPLLCLKTRVKISLLDLQLTADLSDKRLKINFLWQHSFIIITLDTLWSLFKLT